MNRSGTAPPLRAIAALVLSACVGASALCADSEGEGIYRHGMSTTGMAVRGERQPGLYVEGATAACVNCHRRSGLGMKEGHLTIPPVAGKYLFNPRAGNVDDTDLMFVPGMHADRDPYTDATLSKAVREGVGADGKPLDVLMPRFQLDDPQMAALIAYLKGLSPGPSPGATDSTLHFATVLTPDSDPAVRAGVLDVLNKFFDDKNHYTRAESPRLRSSKRMMFKVNRHWQLHVWQLSGAPQTWEAQLRAKLAAQPVFAVISGLGARTWAPVQHFCETEELPCLFPNVDLPVNDGHAFDTLYFSKGVLLEAELIAHGLRARNEHPQEHRIIQVYRSSDVGVEAAAALRQALGHDAASYVDAGLPDTATRKELRTAVGKAGPGDVLVLWLRPQDVAELGHVPNGVTAVYMSGRMGGLDQTPLDANWRAITHMAYPFELPERRAVQVDYPMGWFRMRQIPVVAAQVQADTYLACNIVSDTVNRMVDTFVRDYLVERVEEALEHRVITGYYPRLALAPGQRFASKGGYLVHFSQGPRSRVVADGDWIVP
jgi:mono/diheme cytochrome c family protein